MKSGQMYQFIIQNSQVVLMYEDKKAVEGQQADSPTCSMRAWHNARHDYQHHPLEIIHLREQM